MLTILQKLFIRTKDPMVRRQKLGALCGAYGIFLNLLLFAAKYIAGLTSGSVAITADAFNNLSDAGSSLISTAGFLFSKQKPDAKHPFGHGRIEYVSGFIVSILIFFMGFEILQSAVQKILHPEAVTFSGLHIGILLAAILIKFYMFFYNRRIGNRIDSAAMKATAMDSLSDTLATAAVLIAALCSRFWGFTVDGWVGIAVALFILYAGYGAAKETLSPLLGQASDPELVRRIGEIVLSHREMVSGVHDIIVHDYGPGRRIVSLHAEVSAQENIMKAHDEIDNIENELREKLACDATIHLDPVDNGCKELLVLKEKIKDYLHTLDPAVDAHDFRMVIGITHINVVFDIVLPHTLKPASVEKELNDLVRTLDERYRCVITFDAPFI